MSGFSSGFSPRPVLLLLRIEGLAVLSAAIGAYAVLGGNWWIFAALLLAPDLSMLGQLAGASAGARPYNLAHTYSTPVALGAIALLLGLYWALPYLAIWIAHIGADRALGYGLKYPGSFRDTHLGRIGRKEPGLADPR